MNWRLTGDDVLARVKRLPALSQAAHELERAVNGDAVPTERIVQIVQRDQALTVTVLKLANSSFYGVGGRVVTLRDAVQILGMQTLSAAVTTAAAMSCFDRTACPGFDFEAGWRHALATALCAQMLATSRGVDGCMAYTAGLLHDIGALALASHFPQAYAATLAWSVGNDVLILDAEREMLGIDHATVGGMVARHWNLAPMVADAIRMHHAVPVCPQHAAPSQSGGSLLLDVLHLADAVTHALDLAREANDMVPPLSLDAWDRLGPTAAELQQLFTSIEARVLSLDLAIYP